MKVSFELSSKWTNALVLFFMFWFAALILGHHLWAPGFFHDGYLYAAMGANVIRKLDIFPITVSDLHYPNSAIHPPLTFLVEGLLFKIFGISTLVARGFSVLISILSVLGLVGFLLRLEKKLWAYYAGVVLILTIPFMRKSRFPNTDVLLTLLYSLSMVSAYRIVAFQKQYATNILDFFLFAILAGLGMLTKGPNAIIFFLFLFSYLTFNKSLNLLIGWRGIILCFVPLIIFAWWPLCLYKANAIDQFYDYIQFQVIGTALKGRGKTELDFFNYFHFLLFYCLPWGLVSFCSLFMKKNRDPLYYLFLLNVLSVLIPFSFVKFKYSHYIMPIYPALAAMCGYACLHWFAKIHKKFILSLTTLVILISIGMSSFPIGMKNSRDKELYFMDDFIRYTQYPLEEIINVDKIYSFYSVVNFMSFYYPKVRVSSLHYSVVYSMFKDNTVSPNSIVMASFDQIKELTKIGRFKFNQILKDTNAQFGFYTLESKKESKNSL